MHTELKDLSQLREIAQPVAGEMVVNMGPQHPSTHGVLNFLLVTDGEVMHRAIPHVGYLHRGMEKLAEEIPYHGYMPFTDRLDYLAAMFANQGYAMAVEKLLGCALPPRAEWLRLIACELNRIASHLVATGTLAMDLGAFTPFIHWLRERECALRYAQRLVFRVMRSLEAAGLPPDRIWTEDELDWAFARRRHRRLYRHARYSFGLFLQSAGRLIPYNYVELNIIVRHWRFANHPAPASPRRRGDDAGQLPATSAVARSSK